MLTQLSTVKARLSIVGDADDPTLTRVIESVSARFERFCNRTFGRQTSATEEFSADCAEIAVACYPLEAVTLFEIKSSESTGWQAITPAPEYLIRSRCIVSLESQLGRRSQAARITYTGGYVLPGDEPKPGQTTLPADIQEACIEQVACWYLNRTKLGLLSVTDSGLTTAYAQQELLPAVQATLLRHRRFMI